MFRKFIDWLIGKEPPVPVKRMKGFFSTGINTEDFKRSLLDREEAAKKSIQRELHAGRVVDAEGASSEFAMDSSIQEVKFANSGGYGLGVPDGQFGWYASQGFIGYQTCAIIAQHWLIDKLCTMPGRDAVRHGYEITVNDGTQIAPEVLQKLAKLDRKMGIKKQCAEFVRFARVFGIRHALFVIDSPDPDFYLKPFNPDGITPGSYKGISQIDPYWITPELDQNAAANPGSIDFYKATWWRVNGKRIHKTHFVITKNGDEPADILKPTYMYGGIPMPQKLAERVYAAERMANEAPMLSLSKRTTVLNVDMDAAVANKNAFESKMQVWAEFRDNFGIKVVGLNEQVAQYDTSLTDLDAVIMTQFQLCCAIGEVPSTKVMGTTPKGFNATGEYDEKSYHELLETIQEHDMSPLVERHHVCAIRSYIAPGFRMQPFNTEAVWNPTDSPSAKEQAEVNKIKADTDTVLANSGAIDGQDIRNRLIADKDSGYNGITPDAPPPIADDTDDETQTGQDELEYSFDPATGMLGDARLITAQHHLDPEVVAYKSRTADYVVDVSPVMEIEGKPHRWILDGHHSLAASMADKVQPIFREESGRILNAATRMIAGV